MDANDNVPEFSQKTYTLNVSEDATMGLPLLPLLIVNRDSNAQLDFTIEQDSSTAGDVTSSSAPLPFALSRPPQSNNKAYLALDRALTYKKRHAYSLRVKCVDLLDGLYSSALVDIRVVPNTNFKPRFERDIYKFEIWENASVGAVLGQVHASQQADQQVVYKLVSTTDLDYDPSSSPEQAFASVNGFLNSDNTFF